MFELKVDERLPHHYIIGVAVKPATSGQDAGKLFLKYGPVYFTNEDVEKVSDSLTLMNDKIYTDIYKMSGSQIHELTGCSQIIMSLIGLKLAAQANQATLHHFSCEHELTGAEKFFEGYVERANKYNTEREGLKNAQIRGG